MAKNKSGFAVHVTDPKGAVVCIKPGGEIPPWAKTQITNPYVLKGEIPDGDPVVVDEDAVDDDDQVDDEQDDDDQDDDGGDGDGPPPKAGPGSGTDRWAAYAAKRNVDVDGLNKAGIIAALADAGVPVE